MRKVVRIVGTAFTKRRKVQHWTEGDDELFAGLEALTDWSQKPWSRQREAIEWVNARLADEKAAQAAGTFFKEYEDVGWYLEEASREARIVDHNIAKGDAEWAAFAAMKFGARFAELQLKLAREDLFLAAVSTREAQRSAGEATRKGTDAERLACYRYFRGAGLNKTDATDQAAKKLGVSVATIRAARKGAGASD